MVWELHVRCMVVGWDCICRQEDEWVVEDKQEDRMDTGGDW